MHACDPVPIVMGLCYYIFIVCLTSSGTISLHEERFQISEAGRKQKESI